MLSKAIAIYVDVKLNFKISLSPVMQTTGIKQVEQHCFTQ